MSKFTIAVRKRDSLLARLNSFKSFVDKFITDFTDANQPSNKHVNELNQRIDITKELYTEFCAIQIDIESLANAENIQEQFDARESFDNVYFAVVSEAEDIVCKWREKQQNLNFVSVSSNRESDTHSDTRIQTHVSETHSVKLPDIVLPEFHGSYDQWVAFADTFSTLIHNNDALNDIEKFYYLRTALRGEAIQVIQGLDISATNYVAAWALLEKRYKNKKLMIHNHIKAIIESPKITRESFKSLRQLVDTIHTHIRALSSLEEPVNSWDSLLIYIITDKFDNFTQREWERRTFTKADMPTMNELTEFLETRCSLLEKMDTSPKSLPGNKPFQKVAVHLNTQSKCRLCPEIHEIYKCKEFLDKTVQDRIKFVQQAKLCYNCLRYGHVVAKCNSGGCKTCKEKHNSLLHVVKVTNSASSEETIKTSSSQVILQARNKTSNVLLATAVVRIQDENGTWHEARALLDSGSQSNFVTASLAAKLKLKPKRVSYSISGINISESSVNQMITFSINSQHNKFKKSLDFLIMQQITCSLPTSSISLDEKLPNVNLADNNFGKPGEIDLLIGAEVYFELLQGEQINLGKGLPILLKTKLGWVLSGPVKKHNNENTVHSNHLNLLHSYHVTLEDRMEEFWKIEDFPPTQHYSKEETQCENHFVSTHTRNASGRFIVRLPLKGEASKLGDSKEIAIRRQKAIERKFEKDEVLKAQYSKFMTEYKVLNHMTKSEIENDNKINCFLPHHAVFKQTEVGRKIRVVFDASSKTSSGVALNDIQMVGPTIQQNLFTIILRFRQHKYAIVSDIIKMYRQILVHEDDRNLQTIVWRQNNDEPIESYKLNTVTYGTASAPFLAIRCLHQLAKENATQFPNASRTILEDFYVDDLLSGGESLEEIQQLQKELTLILSSGGFQLDKWRSNAPDFANNLPEQNLQIGNNDSATVKALGLLWNPQNDVIFYKIAKDDEAAVTKRQILTKIAKLFDPLGLLGPIIVAAKTVMQNLWQLKIDWDQPVHEHIQNKWNIIQRDLGTIEDIAVPRCIVLPDYTNIQLHGFADASETAYGAVIYIRSVSSSGEITNCRLLCSKSRIAPLKKLSLPRLELCAALLLARLFSTARNSLNVNFNAVYLWSDSSIVLYWINTEPYKLKTFVSNRIAELQELTEARHWRHVSSADNPADILSRGQLPHILKQQAMWWLGPEWLSLPEEQWPVTNVCVPNEDTELELKLMTFTANVREKCELFVRYSSILRLQRVLSYCFRFIKNSRPRVYKRETGPLTTLELQYSLNTLIRLAQQECYQKEMDDLKKKGFVLSTSSLKQLNPFVDTQGLLRVGGRLKHAVIKYDQKYPIIIPKGHELTKLIIINEHIRLLHAGSQTVIASLRLKFWPIGVQSMTRKLLYGCVKCAKASPRDHQHIMGDLPAMRVTPARAFLNSGVDFCGPILTREYRRRGKATIKSYIAIFVCFVTRAVHLELVTSLSTEAFLGALKRFVARRGKCQNIYCDNGTNFVGAQNELRDLGNLLRLDKTQETVHNHFSGEGIQFHFIPPRSPHFGGLWEAAVKSAKNHLKRVSSKACLTFEEMNTLLAQVESCLNSRPLLPISSDPEDMTVLTPGHFLIGDALNSIPEADITHIPDNKLSHWQRVQSLYQHFWKRWSAEFLSQLQTRSKWYKTRTTLQPGNIVLLKEPTPPTTWKIGRILEVHPGSDNVVRVVTVKTQFGVYKRAANKVCLLPVCDDKTIDKDM